MMMSGQNCRKVRIGLLIVLPFTSPSCSLELSHLTACLLWRDREHAMPYKKLYGSALVHILSTVSKNNYTL